MMQKQKIQNYIQIVVSEIKSQKAVSMVIALALLSVITIIALTSTYVLTNAIRGNTELGSSIRAEAAADSGIEFGLSAVLGKGPGFTLGSADNPITSCISPSGLLYSSLAPQPSNYPCSNADARQIIQYWITSSAEQLDGSYIIPPPGEGNAGENCERINNYDEILEPCNWNKLYYGETIAIPLYTTINGQTINPPDLPEGTGPGLGSLTLKVRTPCDSGIDMVNGDLVAPGPSGEDWCLGGRPDLNDTTPGPGDATDIIVNWQILGDCDYSPDNTHDGPCVGLAVLPPLTSNFSDVNIDVINDGKFHTNTKYSVIGDFNDMFPDSARNKVYDLNTASLHPNPTTIIDYLTDYGNQNLKFPPPNLTNNRIINEPTLTLSVVSPLAALNTLGQVPYVEYQLLTDQPIADSYWTIHSRGSYGNYQVSKKVKKLSSTSNVEFVIQN